MKTVIYLILLFVITGCTRTYTGYVFDSDTRRPVDSVLVTCDINLAEAWYADSLPDSGAGYAFTDNNGFFSLNRPENDNGDVVIWYVRKDYHNGYRDYEPAPGDTFFIRPGPALTEKRNSSRLVRIVRDLPLLMGETTFLVHQMETVYSLTDSFASVSYTAIYIDTNPESEYYNRFTDFEPGEYYYPVPASPLRKIPVSLSRRWITAGEYNDSYYLYASSPFHVMRYAITDTMLLILGNIEGDFSTTYSRIDRIGPDHYLVKDIGREGFLACDELHIYMVDPARGVAVFEQRENGEVTGRSLCIDAGKARKFPIIVHESVSDVMPGYYPLDMTDFNRLLEKFRK